MTKKKFEEHWEYCVHMVCRLQGLDPQPPQQTKEMRDKKIPPGDRDQGYLQVARWLKKNRSQMVAEITGRTVEEVEAWLAERRVTVTSEGISRVISDEPQ